MFQSPQHLIDDLHNFETLTFDRFKIELLDADARPVSAFDQILVTTKWEKILN